MTIIAPRRDEPVIDSAGAMGRRFSEYVEQNAEEVNRLSPIVDKLVSNSVSYSTSNATVSRTLNADTATTAQIADVLGTLIADLKSAGII